LANSPPCPSVLHDELLTEMLRQPFRDNSCRDVGPAACREPDEEMYRPGRIGLRHRHPRSRRERRSTRSELQKSTARSLQICHSCESADEIYASFRVGTGRSPRYTE
jgi:hypothetical protein